ncbi:molybdenum cofactor guanylyltransferase [Leeuwenhoekiella sp. MAR_2009_132]|uniref:molybdenum cofactor guanylyltransferase n=1 Tax=Leeuwenhoekiella sp. MAR_2009_132 TaxID=1392489 RepID=UPI00048EB187|nr:molybdenum cofactor guanylyltransferase [Leeuwenhoekiella sp. MAR_2009_132]
MKSLNHIPAYILCGGKSTRMLSEKGLVELQDKTFVEHIINTLQKIKLSIFLVTENPSYTYLGIPTMPDIYKEKGPLGGIYAALKHTDAAQILILSCDIPLLSMETLQTLLSSDFTNYEITFASAEGRWHPLIGIYSRTLLPDIEQALQENKLKLTDFIKDHKYKQIAIANARSLVNINTPEALAELENSLKYYENHA